MAAMMRWIGKVSPMRLVVLLGIAGAVVTVVCLMFSCDPHLDDRQPLRVVGVPAIRVRVLGPCVGSATVSTSGEYTLRAAGRTVAGGAAALLGAEVTLRDGRWRVIGHEMTGGTIEIVPHDGGCITLGGVQYRGGLQFVAAAGGFYAVNHVDLESYLAGVLRKELYAHWSDATYEAQVIAARTFAMYKIATFGKGRKYDLTNTQNSQVYGGVSAETDKAWRAVRGTHGKVLVYAPPGGEPELILAHYSSCCGGTVNTARVLRSTDDIPPLRGGQKCNDCRGSSRYTWPPVTVSKDELFRCLGLVHAEIVRLKGIKEIRVATRTTYGLALWVDIVGPSGGKVRVRYNGIRSALQRGRSPAAGRLHSMNCRMRDRGKSIEFYEGRGFGHGVGLCQWGAEGKAKRGWSSSRILKFYYQGITIHRAY